MYTYASTAEHPISSKMSIPKPHSWPNSTTLASLSCRSGEISLSGDLNKCKKMMSAWWLVLPLQRYAPSFSPTILEKEKNVSNHQPDVKKLKKMKKCLKPPKNEIKKMLKKHEETIYPSFTPLEFHLLHFHHLHSPPFQQLVVPIHAQHGTRLHVESHRSTGAAAMLNKNVCL